MRLLSVYKCLCDETRLRILNLLTVSPLCVCHLQSVLGRPQVTVSQHLAALRAAGMVRTRRHRQWIIYSLPERPSPELTANLKCLQDCATTEPVFRRDLARLRKLGGNQTTRALLDAGCCPAPAVEARSTSPQCYTP
jgi:DNA-binding transcriptional ArsR family regulator